MTLITFISEMNTTTEAKSKPKSPFAKKESALQSLPTELEPGKPLIWLEKPTNKNKWLGKRTREDAFGEEEAPPSEEEKDSVEEDHSDEEMDEASQEESLELAISSVLKACTQLRSIMFASLCWAMSQPSTSRKTTPSISLTSVQATEQLLEMVEKYLSGTSK